MISNTFPVGSIAANLHPVLKAGSTPNTNLSFNGACNNRLSKFIENTLNACCWALSVKSLRISLSTDGKIKRLKASFTHSWIILLIFDSLLLITPLKIYVSNLSSSIIIDTVNTFSFSALLSAKTLCDAINWTFSW